MKWWGYWVSFILGLLAGYGVAVLNIFLGASGWGKFGKALERWLFGEVDKETKKKGKGGSGS